MSSAYIIIYIGEQNLIRPASLICHTLDFELYHLFVGFFRIHHSFKCQLMISLFVLYDFYVVGLFLNVRTMKIVIYDGQELTMLT